VIEVAQIPRNKTDEATRTAPPSVRELRGVLYIAGYGRSGSTLLGRILAANRHVIDLGEVVRTARYLGSRKRRCVCGEVVANCPVWGGISAALATRRRHANAVTHVRILEAIASATGFPVLVDSSKTALRQAARPFFLARNLSMPLTMVHMVRDPRGVLWSVLRERARYGQASPKWLQLALAIKISAAWSMANITAELFGLWSRDRYVRVRYDEAMTEGVPALLHGLIPPGPLQGRTFALRPENHHAVAGNPIRRAHTVVIAGDEDWRAALQRGPAALTRALCLPLMLRYGLLKPRRSAPGADPNSSA
jgi:hypothetical protein